MNQQGIEHLKITISVSLFACQPHESTCLTPKSFFRCENELTAWQIWLCTSSFQRRNPSPCTCLETSPNASPEPESRIHRLYHTSLVFHRWSASFFLLSPIPTEHSHGCAPAQRQQTPSQKTPTDASHPAVSNLSYPQTECPPQANP